MLRSRKQYLQDVLDYSKECQGYVSGKTYLGFANDDRLKRAVERTLQIVGEAIWQAAKLDPDIFLLVSSCRQIVGLRHRLVHQYDDISEQILWAIVNDRLPRLDKEISNLLADLSSEQDNPKGE